MQKYQTILTLFISLFWAAESLSAPASTSHSALANQLDNATNWSKHLRDEAAKGKKMDDTHLKQEIQGIKDAIKAMEASYAQIAQESPADVQEGHFLALKKHQEKAAELVGQFEAEHGKANPNYSTLKKIASKVMKELAEAKHQHGIELHEIETRH